MKIEGVITGIEAGEEGFCIRVETKIELKFGKEHDKPTYKNADVRKMHLGKVTVEQEDRS